MTGYCWRFGDDTLTANIRRRWPIECRLFNDLELAHLHSEFSMSGDYGAKFPEWLDQGPIKDAPFTMQDVETAAVAELTFSEDGKFWLNIDGKCGFRIGKVTGSIIIDPPGNRKSEFHISSIQYNRRTEDRRQPDDAHFAGNDRRMKDRRG